MTRPTLTVAGQISPDRLLLSIPEAMTALGIGRTMLYELIHSQDLALVKIGRRSFITAKSLSGYVDRITAEAARQPTSD